MSKRLLVALMIATTFLLLLPDWTYSKNNETNEKEPLSKIRPHSDNQWFTPNLNPTLAPLRKVIYRCKELTPGHINIKFRDGLFETEGGGERINITFADGALGDLNGDGNNDGVAVLKSNSGGSGIFVTVAIVMNQNGKLKNTDCVFIGDREIIKSIKIRPNKVTLDMLLHLSGEPLCCPESPLKFTFNISPEGRILNKQTFINISAAGSALSLGQIIAMNKEYDKAITHYNNAIRLYPQYEQAYLSRSYTLMELGRFSQALKDLDAALKLNPKSAGGYYERARCFLELKRYELAIRDVTHTIEMKPENADAYYLRAFAYKYLLKYKESIRDFSFSIDMFPKMQHEPCRQWQNMYEAAYLSRAGSYALLKDYPNAIADLSKIINMTPPQEDKSHICIPEKEKYKSRKGRAYALRGKVYADLNNYKQAIQDSSMSIENDPKSESAYNARGSYYFEAGEYKRAINDFTDALNLSKTSRRKLDNLICLASVHYQEKSFEKAKQYFQKALELEPKLRHGMKILKKRNLVYSPKMEKVIVEMMRGTS